MKNNKRKTIWLFIMAIGVVSIVVASFAMARTTDEMYIAEENDEQSSSIENASDELFSGQDESSEFDGKNEASTITDSVTPNEESNPIIDTNDNESANVVEEPTIIEHQHVFETVIVKPATCTEQGETETSCTECNLTTKDTIPTLGHDYNITNVIPATSTETGIEEQTCGNCGDVKIKVLPRLSVVETDMCEGSFILHAFKDANYLNVMKGMIDKINGVELSEASLSDETPASKALNVFIEHYRYLYDFVGAGSGDSAYGFIRGNSEKEMDLLERVVQSAQNILDELGVNRNTTKKEALILINQYVCDAKEYDYEIYHGKKANNPYLEYSFYGKKGVCENYSVMFQVLCLQAGIECHVYVSPKMGHAWNKVYFSDGSHLWFDSTWNDTNADHEKYMFMTDDDLIRYGYILHEN